MEIFGELFPNNVGHNQDFWIKHFDVLKNDGHHCKHLGAFDAVLGERLVFFQETPNRNNGILLITVCAAAWQIVRELAGISGDERLWFRKKHANLSDEVFIWLFKKDVLFFEGIHRIYKIQTFLRHPCRQLDEYEWVLSECWPQEEIDSIICMAHHLDRILGLAYNEFSIGAGWENEWQEKRLLHDNAMAANGA